MADPDQQRAQLRAAIAKTGWRGNPMPPPMPGPTSRRLYDQAVPSYLLSQGRSIDSELELDEDGRALMAARDRTEMARADLTRRAMALPGGAGPIVAGIAQLAPIELADPRTAQAVMQGASDTLQPARDAVADMAAGLGYAGPNLGRAAAMRAPDVPDLPLLEFEPRIDIDEVRAGIGRAPAMVQQSLDRAPAMLNSAARAAPSMALDAVRATPGAMIGLGGMVADVGAEMSGVPGLGRMRDQFGVMQRNAYMGDMESAFNAGMAGLGEGALAAANVAGSASLLPTAVRGLGAMATRAAAASRAPSLPVPMRPEPYEVGQGQAIPGMSRAELEAVQGFAPNVVTMRPRPPATIAEEANAIIAARSAAQSPMPTQAQMDNAPEIAAMIRRSLGLDDVADKVVEVAPDVAMGVRPPAANQTMGGYGPQSAGMRPSAIRPTAPRLSMSPDDVPPATAAPEIDTSLLDSPARLRNMAALADEATGPSLLPAPVDPEESEVWRRISAFRDDMRAKNIARADADAANGIAPPIRFPLPTGGRQAPDAMRRSQFPRDIAAGNRKLLAAVEKAAEGRPPVGPGAQFVVGRSGVAAADAPMAPPLDMSQEARLARAKGMKFGDDVVYHATDGDFSQFDNAKLGKNTRLNATDFDEGSFANNLAMLGHWTHSKPLANEVVASRSMNLLLRGNRENFDSLADLNYAIRDAGGPDAFRNKLQRQGFTGVTVKDEEFNGISQVTFDPKNIRSVNAAFDPAKTDSSDLLAMRKGQFPPSIATGNRALVNAISDIAEGMPARPGGARFLDDDQIVSEAARYGYTGSNPQEAGTFLLRQPGGQIQAMRRDAVPPPLKLRQERIADRGMTKYEPPPGMPRYMVKPAELAKNGFTLDEIAEETELAGASVRSILHRARQLDPSIPQLYKGPGDRSRLDWAALGKEIARARAVGERVPSERVQQVLGVKSATSLRTVLSQARKGLYGPEVQQFVQQMRSNPGVPGGYGAAALGVTGAGAGLAAGDAEARQANR